MKNLSAFILILSFIILPSFSEESQDSKNSNSTVLEDSSEKEIKKNQSSSLKLFSLSPLTDSLLIAGGIGLNTTNIILEKVCHYNSITTDQYDFSYEKIPTFDQLFMTDYSKGLNYTAYGTLFCVGISPLIFISQPKSDWLPIAVMYGESLLWANGFKELGKILVNRARPYMYFDNYPQDKVDDGDWAKSWPSGHTTMAFTSAMFTSYLFCQYNPDSKYKIPVIAGTFSLATATGILRMCSGNHFYSDVISGMVIGSVSGFVVPMLHSLFYKYQKKSNTNISLSPNGFYLTIAF
ncbi:MAG: phosphatase PAP2 family protein [Treponema sp.]|nr:phosphatase PAP2 family protein [Treponema sp.]